MYGEAAHVQLVDDALEQRSVQRLVMLPVGQAQLFDDANALRHVSGSMVTPHALAGDDARDGIDQQARGIEAVDRRIGIGLHVEAVGVVHSRLHVLDIRVPHLAGAVAQRVERQFGHDIVGRRIAQDKRARSGILGIDGEVHSGTKGRGSHRNGHAALHRKRPLLRRGSWLDCGRARAHRHLRRRWLAMGYQKERGPTSGFGGFNSV